MQVEVFKDIPGYEGKYQVSNLGRVKSLSREIYKLDGTLKKISKNIILKNRLYKRYYGVILYKDNLTKSYKVHQLVAISFLNHTPCGYKLVVDHIDNNPLNNRVENLQIISSSLNSSKDKKNKTSKYTGVHFNKKRNKWVASIRINNKKIILGSFNCETKAYIVYNKKRSD